MISHVNAYILDDEDGISIIDTGLSCVSCKESWTHILTHDFKNKSIKELLLLITTQTILDYLVGLKKFNTEIWTSRSSWLTGRMLTLDKKNEVSTELLNFGCPQVCRQKL